MSAADKTKLDGVAAGATADAPSTTTPKSDGTAATGTETGFARGDHIHPTDTTRAPANVTLTDAAASTTLPATTSATPATLLQTIRNNLKALFSYFSNGVANSAAKWSTARTVSLSGDITGSASLDGSANTSIAATLAASGVTAGSYGPSAAGTVAFGGSVNVPQVTADSKGRVTSAANRSITLPAAPTSVSGNAGTATTLATARTIDGVSFNGSAAINHFGTCSTAAGTAAKTVSLSGFSLVTGAEITITFTATNTAASPTLNVNGTGAKSIYYRNAAISAGYLAANRTYRFVYDGSQYELIGDINTNTTYGVATTSANGLMSSTDKTKLDNLVSLTEDIDDALDLINGETV
jgi:hypothetical protein